MASVYILYSQKLDRFYIGSCNNLEQRLFEHKSKKYKDSFTASADDWILFFEVDKLTLAQCRLIEEHIKKMKSRKYIQNIKDYPEIIEKLKRKYN